MKVGIACKVETDAQKQINKLTFDIIQWDYNRASRTSPLGRAWTVQTFVGSILVLAKDIIGLVAL